MLLRLSKPETGEHEEVFLQDDVTSSPKYQWNVQRAVKLSNIREGEGGTPIKRAVLGQGLAYKDLKNEKDWAAKRLKEKKDNYNRKASNMSCNSFHSQRSALRGSGANSRRGAGFTVNTYGTQNSRPGSRQSNAPKMTTIDVKAMGYDVLPEQKEEDEDFLISTTREGAEATNE